MRKLKLDLDTLKVDSFATDADAEGPGTVHGHYTAPGCFNVSQLHGHGCEFVVAPGQAKKSDFNTCKQTCWDIVYTCQASCNGTCFPGSCACPSVQCSVVICIDTTIRTD